MVRFILMGILAYVGIKAVRSVVRYLRASPSDPGAELSPDRDAVSDMVRDPVCGTYVVANQSLHASRHGVRVYFCSEDCRRRFVADSG